MCTKSVFFDLGSGAEARQPPFFLGAFLIFAWIHIVRTFPQIEVLCISTVTHVLCPREVPSSIVDLDPVCLDCRVLWFSSLILSEN